MSNNYNKRMLSGTEQEKCNWGTKKLLLKWHEETFMDS